MLVLGGYLLTKGVKLEGAQWFGKLATTLFYVSMTLIILWPAQPPWLTALLLCLVALSSLAAAAMYLPEFLRYRREAKEAA